MFKKMIPAVLVVVAAPVLACGSSPNEEASASSSEALGRIGWTCAPGAQTVEGGWVDGTYAPGTWYPTGQTYTFLDTWELFGDYNWSTGNVDALIWVRSEYVLDFAYYNDVCFTHPLGHITPSNPPGTGGKSPGVHFPQTCMMADQLSTALSQNPYCTR